MYCCEIKLIRPWSNKWIKPPTKNQKFLMQDGNLYNDLYKLWRQFGSSKDMIIMIPHEALKELMTTKSQMPSFVILKNS